MCVGTQYTCPVYDISHYILLDSYTNSQRHPPPPHRPVASLRVYCGFQRDYNDLCQNLTYVKHVLCDLKAIIQNAIVSVNRK